MKKIRNAMLLVLLQPLAVYAGNDYPTLDRVNYALDCMDRHGEMSITNLASCSCTIDAIASKMKYEKYSDAKTYEEYKDTPGDKGDAFRGNEKAKGAYNKLNALEVEAEKNCFVKQIAPKVKVESAAEDTKGTPSKKGAPSK